jgi:hypothetical protein
MFNRIQLSFVVGGALLALVTAQVTARAADLNEHPGPVGTDDTILATFGNKHVIAFFERDNGRCDVSAVVFEKTDADTGMTTAARVRVSLHPHEMVHIDSSDNQTLHLHCGSNAATLAALETDNHVASGRRNQSCEATKRKGARVADQPC